MKTPDLAARRLSLPCALAMMTGAASGCGVWIPPSASHPQLGTRVSLAETHFEAATSATASTALSTENGARENTVTTLSSSDGSTTDGRRLVILVWSPWCASCKQWLALVDRLWQQKSNRSAAVLGVAVHGTPSDSSDTVAEYRIRFPQVYDPDGTWMQSMQLDSIPRLVVLDRRGCLAYVSPSDASTTAIEAVFSYFADAPEDE